MPSKPTTLARRALRSQRTRVLRLLEVAEQTIERAERRVTNAAPAAAGGAQTSPTKPRGTRAAYGDLWIPPDEATAVSAIFNTTDLEVFERTGEETAMQLAALFGPDDVVMDVGCGIGRVARYVAGKCRRLWAVDASPRMLEMARTRLAELDNVEFAQCAGVTIPDVGDGTIDTAYSILVLQHLEREDAFLLLRDIHRTLKPGGTAYFTFPNLLSEEYLESFVTYAETGEVANPVRARIYTPQEASTIVAAAGYQVVDQIDGTEIELTCRTLPSPEQQSRQGSTRPVK